MTIKEELIIEQLTNGLTQQEIAIFFVRNNIKPCSVSSIEKTIRSLREQYGAKTMYHLGVILQHKIKPLNKDILSKREYDTLVGIADGKRNKVIGQELGITTRTVEVHTRKIRKKLNIRPENNNVVLVRKAISQGVISI